MEQAALHQRDRRIRLEVSLAIKFNKAERQKGIPRSRDVVLLRGIFCSIKLTYIVRQYRKDGEHLVRKHI